MYGSPIPYTSDVETVAEDESEFIRKLRDLFVDMASKVADAEGHAFRAVHAKGQAHLKGSLKVAANLRTELRQGLFAVPGSYQALLRFSSPPAEQLPDSVSTPRAVALKVMGVSGERIEGAIEASSQDFLLVNGPTFTAPDPAGFLKPARLIGATTERMPNTKKVISAALRGAEAMVEALGGQSGKLKGMGGEPQRHPLGETYFSQVPIRFGDFMAKVSLAPVSSSLLALEGERIGSGPQAQREAIAAVVGGLGHPLEWELRVQLCRDLERMPIEDASVEWPEALSPWQSVGVLSVPHQASWNEDSQQADDRLAFSPWNALSAHQPLGGVNRARRVVMAASRQFRTGFNGCPLHDAGHTPQS